VRHALTAIAIAAIIAACASPGLPPGGPTVSSFARVIATKPDTSALNVTPGKVLIRYDDVIGEQASGGDLARSVLISPWDGEPRVEWKRTGMTIRPRNGWRANTAYTITILPGVQDLRGQPSPYGYSMRFSTGATIPKGVVRGVTFDWAALRPLAKATVQAIDLKDTTLVYITQSDSTGRFELGTLPPGKYIVRAIDEKSPNRKLEPREPWDTLSVTIADSARAELYMFVHDSLPIRISELRQVDSVTVNLLLDKPLQPGQTLSAASARIVKADSSPVTVASVLTAAQDRARQATADSLLRAKDTTLRAPDAGGPPRRTIDPNRRNDTTTLIPPPKPSREALTNELFIRVAQPLEVGATYRITLTGLKNMLGIDGAATRLLIIPKPAPIDSTRLGPPGRGVLRDSVARTLPPPVRPPARPPT
jgi:Bacterial Ig-like domain